MVAGALYGNNHDAVTSLFTRRIKVPARWRRAASAAAPVSADVPAGGEMTPEPDSTSLPNAHGPQEPAPGAAAKEAS